jgi:hypothetical protein
MNMLCKEAFVGRDDQIWTVELEDLMVQIDQYLVNK